MIRKIEIERFSLVSSKPFDQVVAALDASIGHPDMAEFRRSTQEASSFADLKRAVEKGLSEVGLMLFMELDHGAVLRKETGRDTPRIVRFIIGNPLIMKEMAKHVPDAGSYAPVTVLVDERVSCLSWNWRGRSSVKITERTHGKTAKALHWRRDRCHPETALIGQSAGFRSV